MEKIQYLNQVCNNKVDSIRVALENQAPSELPDCADGDSWMVCNPLFGKMKMITLGHLIGKSNRPPILHPVPLTIVDTKIDTFNDVSNVLRHTVDLCTLLARNQIHKQHILFSCIFNTTIIFGNNSITNNFN